MQKLENNPLNISKQRGFNTANTNHAYNAYFLTLEQDSDFVSFAQRRIEDGSYYICFMLRANETLNDEMQKKILHGINLLKSNFPDVEFKISFSNVMRYYTSEEFKKLLEIKQEIIKNYNEDYELLFAEGSLEFNEREILNANSRISEVVNTIKSENLSPIEAVMYVHTLLTEREYFMENNANKNRNIYSILNQKNIICTGFASLFSAIFIELNDPRIKVKEAAISFNRGSKFHAINYVYINDEKYGYEGYYSLDACANVENKMNHGLDYFMMPIGDVDYAYRADNRKLVFETIDGNLGNNTIPFARDAEQDGWNYSVANPSTFNIKRNYREKILEATKDFLNTNFANKFLKKHEDYYDETIEEQENLYSKVITNVVRETEPIKLEDIEKAFTVITKKFIKPTDMSAKQYANLIIQQTIAGVPKIFSQSYFCKNAFAQEYERIQEQTV